jgi:hypothetical protein
VSNLLSQIIFLLVGLALYQLLKSVNKNMAAVMVILNLVGVPITMLNDLYQLATLLLLHSADSLRVFTGAFPGVRMSERGVKTSLVL